MQACLASHANYVYIKVTLIHVLVTVTVSCKCHVERGSREPVDYWKDHLVTAVSLSMNCCCDSYHEL